MKNRKIRIGFSELEGTVDLICEEDNKVIAGHHVANCDDVSLEGLTKFIEYCLGHKI